MFCVNDFCISLWVLGYYVIVGIIVIVLLSRRKSEELGLGGQPSQPRESIEHNEEPGEPIENEEEEDIKDKSDYIRVKKGDKIPFEDWVFEVIGIDDNDDAIFGDLIVTLPLGAKFLSLTRQQAENYPAGVLGFTIVYDPAGPAVAETITYDPDPDSPHLHEDYEMRIEEILVYEEHSTS